MPVEVTDGLRILGIPIGSPAFCKTFILKQLQLAKSDSAKTLASLEDLQMVLRIYTKCTVHKLTHIFATDVLSTDTVADLPKSWYL